MLVRKLALATAVLLGTLGFVNTADAQIYYSSGSVGTPIVTTSYYTPAYSSYYSPTVTYSVYTPPAYPGWYSNGYPYNYTYVTPGYATPPYYSLYYSVYAPAAPVYYGRRGLLGWRSW
jgi:hypothetical protein